MKVKRPSMSNGRHLISLTTKVVEAFDVIKPEIEKQLGVELTYSQVVEYLINQWKEKK